MYCPCPGCVKKIHWLRHFRVSEKCWCKTLGSFLQAGKWCRFRKKAQWWWKRTTGSTTLPTMKMRKHTLSRSNESNEKWRREGQRVRVIKKTVLARLSSSVKMAVSVCALSTLDTRINKRISDTPVWCVCVLCVDSFAACLALVSECNLLCEYKAHSGFFSALLAE